MRWCAPADGKAAAAAKPPDGVWVAAGSAGSVHSRFSGSVGCCLTAEGCSVAIRPMPWARLGAGAVVM